MLQMLCFVFNGIKVHFPNNKKWFSLIICAKYSQKEPDHIYFSKNICVGVTTPVPRLVLRTVIGAHSQKFTGDPSFESETGTETALFSTNLHDMRIKQDV